MSRSLAAEGERSINLYCELIESGNDASREGDNWVLYGTPGRQLYCTLDDSPISCVVSSNQQFAVNDVSAVYFAIAGSTLYSIANHYDGVTFTGIPTTIGTVDKKVINNTGGQLFPTQILVLNPNLLFVVANGRTWVAAYGTPITASSLNFGGLGYAPGDTGIIVGSNGLNAKYRIQTVDTTANGTILTSAVNNWGSGYAVGDTGTITGSTGVTATYTITQVSATGQVQAFTLTGGNGYAASLNVGTLTGGGQPGTGSGFTVNILTISNSLGAVLTYTLTQDGSGYAVGTNIATTAQGNQPGAGDGNFTVDITSVGPAVWQLVEQFIPEGTPGNYVTYATFMDNYVIVSLAGNLPDPTRRQFYISGVSDPSSWSALDFGTKEGNSDPNVSVFAANEVLNVFGLVTLERWLDLPNGPAFPFQRMQGAGLVNVGCASEWTVCIYKDTVVWIGNDAQGQLVCWSLSGQQPQRISNFCVENRWRNFDITGSSAFTYEEDGHYFYVVHFPIPDETWVCDLSTIGPDNKPVWHERLFWDETHGQWHADIGRYHAWSFPIAHVVGDYSNGNLYIQSIDILADNCNAIRRLRVTPHINNELKWTWYSRFRLQLQSGIYPPGVSYTLSLRTSDDGGFTFGNYLTRSGGQLGNYEGIVPVEWYRLGRSRNRVYEVSTSDPVPICWVDASIEVRPGTGV